MGSLLAGHSDKLAPVIRAGKDSFPNGSAGSGQPMSTVSTHEALAEGLDTRWKGG